MPESTPGAPAIHGPSAVGLTRLSKRLSFPPGGEALYRHILQMVDLGREDEFVVVPCGRGASALFVAEASGASGAGTDTDDVLVGVANHRANREGAGGRLHFETAPLDDLPYQDAVFDLTLGEIELGAARDVRGAVREIARVTRPGGTVVLVQLVWNRAVETERGEDMVARLGVRPHLVVEWKQMLREAVRVDHGAVHALHKGNSLLPVGVVDITGEFERGDTIHVEDPSGREVAHVVCVDGPVAPVTHYAPVAGGFRIAHGVIVGGACENTGRGAGA